MKENILLRRVELQALLKELKEKEDDLEEELIDLLYSCKHEITVTTATIGVPEEYFKYMVIPRTYCLLCKKQLGPRKHITEAELKKMNRSVSIKLDDYPGFVTKWKEFSCHKVEELYIKKRKEFSEISEIELAGKITEVMKETKA